MNRKSRSETLDKIGVGLIYRIGSTPLYKKVFKYWYPLMTRRLAGKEDVVFLNWGYAIVNTCGSRSLRGLRSGRFVGAFDEFAVLECCAGTNECDQVRRVDGAPA